MRKLTVEEVKGLTELEHKMDSGKQPFVMSDGGRMSVAPEIMQELGLRTGQTVSHLIVLAIMEMNIAHLTAKIALNKANLSLYKKD